MGSEADRQMIRLAKDRETLERFASVANSFDSEDAKRTARAVMASAQQLAPFEGRRRAAGCDAALNAFVGELANAAGFMDTYLEYEWRPRLSVLTDPQQTRDAERLIGQFEKQIKLRGGLGKLSDDAVRQKLYELVRMTSECVRQWRDIPGLVPSGR